MRKITVFMIVAGVCASGPAQAALNVNVNPPAVAEEPHASPADSQWVLCDAVAVWQMESKSRNDLIAVRDRTLSSITSFTGSASQGQPPYTDHLIPTDYTEDYRPQFHFSPRNGWMNDINALWKVNDTYHMIYQYAAPGTAKSGAYATSKDLMHWEDKGVALMGTEGVRPNVAGKRVFSGSGVLVEGKVAEKITGSPKQAMVTLYTGTGVGTCIAWSSDEGKTWHNYPGNPVANPTETAIPRDPYVFRYEPEDKWCMAIYDVVKNKDDDKINDFNGMAFYESRDLINWKETGRIPFGHECPDMFELPLDGNPKATRWVLYDANGTYLVGNFDGKTFHPEDPDWKDKKVVMDQGPDFYAAQHFYRTDPLKEPVIQITWMDHWNGPLGLSKAVVEKAILETLGVKKGINQTLLSREESLKLPIPFEAGWERNATIPVTVELVTYRGKPTLRRNPVESIKNLYTATMKWQSEILPGNGSKNLLSGIQSKTCDITAVFDLKNVSTGEIVFHLNGRDIRYDIAGHNLIGKRQSGGVFEDTPIELLPLENGLLTIRILLDWSSVEIFGNDGLFAYTEHYAFDPKNKDVGITAKGADVPLVSLTFNEVGSIWKSFQGK